MAEILELIKNYAFPAVMCLLLWKQNVEMDQRFSQLLENSTAALTGVMNALNELKNAVERMEDNANNR